MTSGLLEKEGSRAGARPDFFVSYTEIDRQWAEWIGWQLEAAGYQVLLQAWDFGPGSNFVLGMDKALRDAERIIVVLSQNYSTSVFGQSEWAAGFAADPTGDTGKLLPVKVGHFEPRGLLRQMVWVDLVNCSEETASQRLLAAAHRQRAKPIIQPYFPGTTGASAMVKPLFPEAFPPIWNVPARNPNFTGQTRWLEQLDREAKAGERAVVIQAISGLGGIGKSQLAIEFAHRRRAAYRLVWWIRAETIESLAADLVDLANRLSLPGLESQTVDKQIALLRLWLEKNAGWLLIFDNVENPNQIIDILPQAGAGHVLVTSRFRAWGNIAKVLSLQVWAPDEAVSYLVRRTGQADAQAASILAGELGYLPLALEQAAAYIDECQITIERYTMLFKRSNRGSLLKANSGKAAVSTIWNLSLQAVQRQSEDAVTLLQLLAFLPPDNFPRERLVQNNASGLSDAVAKLLGNELVLNEAIAVLRRYSLVEATLDRISVHRLVQAVVREGVPNSELRKFVDMANQIQHGVAEGATEASYPKSESRLSQWKKVVVGAALVVLTGALVVSALFLPGIFQQPPQQSSHPPIFEPTSASQISKIILKSSEITTRQQAAGAASLSEPSQPLRTGVKPDEKVAQLHQIVAWLDVESSRRYASREGYAFPNIYAHGRDRAPDARRDGRAADRKYDHGNARQ